MVDDIGDEFIGINDAGDKFFTCVVDTNDKVVTGVIAKP
jgi:hypothetical protein